MNDTANRARDLLADALDLEPDEIGDDASIETVGAWTSLGHLRLILALEEVIGHELDAGSVARIATLKDVESLLKSALKSAA